MKKYLKALTALLLSALMLTPAVSARPLHVPRGGEKRGAPAIDTPASAQPGGWYCMRNGEGVRPELPSEFSFIRGHECYYLGDDAKTVYLTFDAGYNNGNIERVLDALSAHSATGAFFVVSNLIKTEPQLVERMASEGHLVCNHTMRHRDMRQMNEDEFKDELLAVEKLYSETTGHELAKFYRPPRGEFNENNLIWAESIGYKTVLWSVAYADWNNDDQPDVESSLALLKSRVHPGAIILLHPTSASNAALLDAFLTYLESEGYSFGSLADLSQNAKKKE
ncbi:MAG: polysaccharide deacetylase family protein [Clostridia bacterium]|nr:polysaccharide deacetylase family protein [Clostridia bacterium]